MQWDDVRFFIVLARAGSLSAAARKLHVEHTTVARRVIHLEETLQIKLFDRLPRGWVLTEEGHALLAQTSILKTQMLAIQRSVLKNETLSGKIQLSAPPHLLNYFLLPKLKDFAEQYPGIHLELVGERKNADMLSGEADLALRMAKPNEQGLIARKITDIHYSLYATQTYLNLPKSEQKFIGFDDSMTNLIPKKWLDEHLQNAEYSIKSNDIMTMYQAALHSWGIAILPDFLIESSSMIKIATETHPSVPLFLVVHPDIRRAPKIRVLMDFIIDLMPQTI